MGEAAEADCVDAGEAMETVVELSLGVMVVGRRGPAFVLKNWIFVISGTNRKTHKSPNLSTYLSNERLDIVPRPPLVACDLREPVEIIRGPSGVEHRVWGFC